MSGWSGGYISESGYVPGYYTEQSPDLIQFAMLLRGFAPAGVAAEAPAYCELGFGYGVSAAVIAAAHPHLQVWGTDFLPEHVAVARDLTTDVCANLRVFDDSFAQFAERDLPQFDFIALHGIWSWVAPAVRRDILAFIARRLKVGGAVYVSYNALPGWHVLRALRDLLVLHARSTLAPGQPVAAQVGHALAEIERLVQNKAPAVVGNGALMQRLQQAHAAPAAYVAHEYLHEHWQPFYFTEVADDMAQAKLGYVGRSKLIDTIDSINVAPAAQQHLATIANEGTREVLRDFYLGTGFRNDVFCRGARRLTPVERDEQLDRVRLVLARDPQEVPLKLTTPLGETTLHDRVYRPLLERLQRAGADGVPIGQFRREPGLKDLPAAAAIESATALVGIGAALPIVDARGGDAARATRALNERIIKRSLDGFGIDFLASPVTRGGHRVDRLTEFIVDACWRGLDDVEQIARSVWGGLQRVQQRAVKDGKALQTEDENLAYIRSLAQAFLQDGRKTFEHLGIL